MKDIIIIGAGGCGREVLQWIKDINKISYTWNIKGFIERELNALDGLACDVPIIGTDDYNIQENDVFVCAVGNSIRRKKIMDSYKERGAEFVSIIHPTAIISDTAVIEDNVIVYPYAIISANTHIGEGALINMHTSIGHDTVIGKYATICAHCDVTGMCTLGKNVFMGTTSHIVPSTHIGDDVYICAGSTVMAPVRSGRKVLGNPAKIVKF